MYATMSFFHQGYDLLSELEPSLRELMANLDEERKLYLTETLKHDVRIFSIMNRVTVRVVDS